VFLLDCRLALVAGSTNLLYCNYSTSQVNFSNHDRRPVCSSIRKVSQVNSSQVNSSQLKATYTTVPLASTTRDAMIRERLATATAKGSTISINNIPTDHQIEQSNQRNKIDEE